MKKSKWLLLGVISMTIMVVASVMASVIVTAAPKINDEAVNANVSYLPDSTGLVYSSVQPDVIWLRKTELENNQLYLVLRVRTNIDDVLIEDMNGESRIEYQYNETEIKYPVSIDCVSEDNIATYVLDNTDSIMSLAGVQDEWETINKADISSLRSKSSVSKADKDLIDSGRLDLVKKDKLILTEPK